MRHLFSHRPRHLIVLFLAGVLASCGGDGSSPTAPSSATGGGGPLSGATIQGRVNGLGGAPAALAVAPAAEVSGDADEGLTIEVLGTGQTVEVGSDGEFVITGLGALADVVLQVSGPDVAGGSQDVPLGTGLAADGMLEVELRVDGGSVVVESVEVEDSPDDDSSDDNSTDDAESTDDDSSDDDSSDDDVSDDVSDDLSDDVSDDDSSDDTSDDDSSDDTSDDDSSDDTSDDDSSDDTSDDDSSDDDA